jgi:Uncharacterized protein conserved in bacteria
MALFTGTFENKVDRKGRVSLPADFRSELSGDDARVIYIYPAPRHDRLDACDKAFMQRLVESIEERPLYSDEEEDLSEIIVATARKTLMDETGRVVLPSDLAALVGITDTAVFVGKGSRFQIWAPEAYPAYFKMVRERGKDRTITLKPKGGAS